MEKAIYKMYFDAGRAGSLQGIFVAEKSKVKELVESGKEVYFGEVIGKHSEVYGPIEKDEIEMVTDNPEFIKIFEDANMETGYNPFNYIEEEEA